MIGHRHHFPVPVDPQEQKVLQRLFILCENKAALYGFFGISKTQFLKAKRGYATPLKVRHKITARISRYRQFTPKPKNQSIMIYSDILLEMRGAA